jgi:uncharacterized protein YbjQ (UPF0145 family)
VKIECPHCGKGLLVRHRADTVTCPACRGAVALTERGAQTLSLVVTTGPDISGGTITAYLGIVGAEVVGGVNLLKDALAAVRDAVGGRAKAIEGEIQKAREAALAELTARALDLGASGVVSVRFDVQLAGAASGMVLVSATGTAVRWERKER